MKKNKKALIAVNYIGFLHFLWSDMDILNEMGYKITAIGDNSLQEEHTLEILRQKGVDFIDVKCASKTPLSKENLLAFKQIYKLIHKEKFDLIHCHTPITGFLVRLATVGMNRKRLRVIYTTHGMAYCHLSTRKEYLKFHAIESLASRLTDAIITINTEDYEACKKLHAKKVYKIDGVGVKTKDYMLQEDDKMAYRDVLGIPRDKIFISTAGELSERKNHKVIIKALSLLPDKEKYVFGVRGRVMTGGKTPAEFERLAKELGVDARLLGYAKDIPQVVNCSDIGVMPSLREGLGFAGVQYLCAGVPVIGTNVQGIPDYVKDGETGYLVDDPNDAQTFADAIKRLSDKATRGAMADNCRAMARKFDIAVSEQQRKKIYEEILK